MNEPLDLSVVIIAFNEEANLSRCLRSLPEGIEIILLDSGSTDRTPEIAREFGAFLHERAFDNFAAQKNAALALAKRRWVLAMDADEELTPVLRDRIAALVREKAPSAAAYHLQRRLVFMGRAMRFGKTRDWPVRLFLREGATYHGAIHEEIRIEGRVKRLKTGWLWHYSYRDLSDYFARFNRYTTAIAERHLSEARQPKLLPHLFRPFLEFFTRYVLRLGFLDGYPGYTYALCSSLYAYIKYAKIFEKRHPL